MKIKQLLEFNARIQKQQIIEQIIEFTWQAKEAVPKSAAPCIGGTLYFWLASLHS